MYTCVNVYVYNTYILIYNTYIHICMYTLVASLSVRKFGSVSFFKQTTNKYAEAAPLRKYANIDFWFRLETKSILKKINIDFVSNQNQWQCAQKTTLLSTFCLLTLFFFFPAGMQGFYTIMTSVGARMGTGVYVVLICIDRILGAHGPGV